MDKLMEMKAELEERENKGFTLMEMLIVVAIIAILIAIAIPVFTGQLEKAREATDAANIRAGYAEVMMAALDSNSTNAQKVVTLQQTQTDWQDKTIFSNLVSLFSVSGVTDSTEVLKAVGADKSATVSWAPGTGTAPGHATVSIS